MSGWLSPCELFSNSESIWSLDRSPDSGKCPKTHSVPWIQATWLRFFFLHTFLILHLFIIANTVLSNDPSTMPSCLILLCLDLPSSWNPPFVGYPGGAATKGTYRYCKRPELSSHHPHSLVPRSLELQFTGVCHTLLASAGTATHGHTRTQIL